MLQSDTLTLNALANPIDRNNLLVNHPTEGIVFGLQSSDSIGYRSGVYSYPSQQAVDSSIKIDGNETVISGLYTINNFDYYITYTLEGGTQQQLWKGELSKQMKVIQRSRKHILCASCHNYQYYDLLENKKDKSSIFLTQLDLWDYHGDPGSWEVDIIKLDTAGNVLWKCRPNNRDSICTSYPTVVQKPNGNLIVCWLDQWYKAYTIYNYYGGLVKQGYNTLVCRDRPPHG